MRLFSKRTRRSKLVHEEGLKEFDSLDDLVVEIHQLAKESGHKIESQITGFDTVSMLSLQTIVARVEAQKVRRNDSAFLLTIFSSLIALATVATTDLIESWTLSHLLTFTFIWLMLLMFVERTFDHQMERLELLTQYLNIYMKERESNE